MSLQSRQQEYFIFKVLLVRVQLTEPKSYENVKCFNTRVILAYFTSCFNSLVLTPIVILVNYLQETKLGESCLELQHGIKKAP